MGSVRTPRAKYVRDTNSIHIQYEIVRVRPAPYGRAEEGREAVGRCGGGRVSVVVVESGDRGVAMGASRALVSIHRFNWKGVLSLVYFPLSYIRRPNCNLCSVRTELSGSRAEPNCEAEDY